MSPDQASAPAHDSVSPPGDLPLHVVEARVAAQETQFRHDNTISPPAPRPDEPVEVWATNGLGVHLERAAVFYTTDGAPPDATAALLTMEAAAVDWDARAGYLTRWRAVIPGQPGGTVVRYRIAGWLAGLPGAPDARPDLWAHDGQGFWFRYPGASGITTFAHRVEPPAPVLPAWARDAVIYHIFLDRFHPGTPDGAFTASADSRARHSGTLRGVLRALPYLADLGVTCLWLSPLYSSETYHRYDTTDLYGVDPALGTAQDLRELVDEAHCRGVRVLLDFVPSHCSWHHPAFEAARRDASAPTASWFTFEEWPRRYRCFLGMAPALPSFNTEDPGARAHIIGSALQWLRDYGVDGFRLDHAIGPGMDFWVAFRAATRAVAPDALTVGEVTDTPDCMRRYRGRLDGVLDFPLARALRMTFATGQWSVDRLDGFLTAYERYMADGPGRVSFLDNHDVNRFLFVGGNDPERLKLAALCQFTLEPTPVIYYGTEIGLSQQHDIAAVGDAEARRDMPWNEGLWDHTLLAFYRDLIRLRREQRALRYGARRTVYLDGRSGTYAYVRSLPEQPDLPISDVLTLFNLGAQERTIALPPASVPPECVCLIATGQMPDLSPASGQVEVRLAPRTGAVLGSASSSRRTGASGTIG